MQSYPVELAYDHCRRMSLYMTLFPVAVGGTMDTANERGLTLTTAMTLRSFTAAVDLQVDDFLR
ncbi:MAG TPA: hypothetical protein VHV82_03605 [Sporichthyaceae bacterium]|jgi:hypothetical protein|nr:hypothetical protein [Sporichthyaceae bacterium]